MPEESHLPDRYNTKVEVMEEAVLFRGILILKKKNVSESKIAPKL